MRPGVALLVAVLASGCAGLQGPAWEQPPPEVLTGPVVDSVRLTRAELSNGLRIIVFEDHRLPRFSAGIELRRGAAIEPLAAAGVATFTASLMERGAGERGALALAQTVDALGATLQTGAGWDSMNVAVSGLARDQDTLFDVLADVVLRPRFDGDEALRVRDELVAAIRKGVDAPGTLAQRSFGSTLYAGHRYGLPAEGNEETVSALGADDAREFHGQLFTPGNAILFATGDVSAADIVRRAEQAFGSWAGPAVPASAPEPELPAPAERRVVIVDRSDLGQAQILIGHDGITRSDPTRVQVSLMNRVLGQSGFSSRLMGRVRGEEGLTYGIYSYFAARRQVGPFAVSVSTRVPKVREVVDIVLEEMARMREAPLAPDELRRVKGLSTSAFVLALESAGAVTGALVDLDVHGLPEDSLDTYRARVAAVEVAETTAAAARLHPEGAAIVVVGPAEALASQLEGLGPIEIIQP